MNKFNLSYNDYRTISLLLISIYAVIFGIIGSFYKIHAINLTIVGCCGIILSYISNDMGDKK